MAVLDPQDLTTSVSLSKSQDPRGLEPYIRERATNYGIDPDVALRVAHSEGLRQFNSGIPGEKSYGAFQLHIGGGLGDEFRRDTGLDPSDPTNERATIDYALKRAAQVGWGPWHGAKNTGIGEWEGISPESPVGVLQSPSGQPTLPPYQGAAPGMPGTMAANVPPTAGQPSGQFGRDHVGGGGGPVASADLSPPAFLQLPPVQAPYFPPRPPPSQQMAGNLPSPSDVFLQKLRMLQAARAGGQFVPQPQPSQVPTYGGIRG
jgi:hypothetical protein